MDLVNKIHNKGRQAAVEAYLLAIFEMGDRDECSWKHLGHGYAAVLAFGDYIHAEDYLDPFGEIRPEADYRKLDEYWAGVAMAIDGLSTKEKIALGARLQNSDGRFMALTNYIDNEFLTYKNAIDERK